MRHIERRVAAQILLLRRLGFRVTGASAEKGVAYDGGLTAEQNQYYELGALVFTNELKDGEAPAALVKRVREYKEAVMPKYLGLSMLLAQGKPLAEEVIAAATRGIRRWRTL